MYGKKYISSSNFLQSMAPPLCRPLAISLLILVLLSLVASQNRNGRRRKGVKDWDNFEDFTCGSKGKLKQRCDIKCISKRVCSITSITQRCTCKGLHLYSTNVAFYKMSSSKRISQKGFGIFAKFCKSCVPYCKKWAKGDNEYRKKKGKVRSKMIPCKEASKEDLIKVVAKHLIGSKYDSNSDSDESSRTESSDEEYESEEYESHSDSEDSESHFDRRKRSIESAASTSNEDIYGSSKYEADLVDDDTGFSDSISKSNGDTVETETDALILNLKPSVDKSETSESFGIRAKRNNNEPFNLVGNGDYNMVYQQDTTNEVEKEDIYEKDGDEKAKSGLLKSRVAKNRHHAPLANDQGYSSQKERLRNQLSHNTKATEPQTTQYRGPEPILKAKPTSQPLTYGPHIDRIGQHYLEKPDISSFGFNTESSEEDKPPGIVLDKKIKQRTHFRDPIIKSRKCYPRGNETRICHEICSRNGKTCTMKMELGRCTCSGIKLSLYEIIKFDMRLKKPVLFMAPFKSKRGHGYVRECGSCVDYCKDYEEQRSHVVGTQILSCRRNV